MELNHLQSHCQRPVSVTVHTWGVLDGHPIFTPVNVEHCCKHVTVPRSLRTVSPDTADVHQCLRIAKERQTDTASTLHPECLMVADVRPLHALLVVVEDNDHSQADTHRLSKLTAKACAYPGPHRPGWVRPGYTRIFSSISYSL